VSDLPDAPDAGPGILETSLVLGLAVVLAAVIVAFFGARWRTRSACSSTPRMGAVAGDPAQRRNGTDPRRHDHRPIGDTAASG
jgi:hypothetical protein